MKRLKLPRISVRVSMLLVLCVAIWLAREVHLARQQREAVAAIEEYGGFVRFDWEYVGGKTVPGTGPRVPGWLRRAFGDDYFQTVLDVDMIHATDRRGKPDLTPGEVDALLARLGTFGRLRRLWMPGEFSTDRGLDAIQGLTELETLMTYGAKITDAGMTKVRTFRSLKALQVEDSGLGDDALAHLASLTRLEHLALWGNRFTDAGMVHLKGLNALQFLSISRSRVTDAGLEELRGLPSLGEIVLTGTATTDEGIERFRDRMPNLHTIRWEPR